MEWLIFWLKLGILFAPLVALYGFLAIAVVCNARDTRRERRDRLDYYNSITRGRR